MDLALAVKSMHFCTVNATLTQLRREAGKVLSAVLQGNKTVRLTQHGRAVAEIRPRPQPLSPAGICPAVALPSPFGEGYGR